MRRFVVFAVLVPMTVLTFVACGDDEETLTTEEFLDQGNAICEAGTAENDQAFQEAFPSGSTEPTPEQIATVVADSVAPNIQAQIDDLEALNPPEDLQDDVDQMLAEAQTVLDGIIDDPEGAFTDENPFAEVDALATEIGLTACAGG